MHHTQYVGIGIGFKKQRLAVKAHRAGIAGVAVHLVDIAVSDFNGEVRGQRQSAGLFEIAAQRVLSRALYLRADDVGMG